MQESAEQHTVKEYNLFNMKSADHRKPYTVTLEVNGKPLVMEIDTGAPYSITPAFQELHISDCDLKTVVQGNHW